MNAVVFPDPVARSTDPETSHEAAKDATFKASTNRLKALYALSMRPMTDYELAEFTGLQQNSIGKRRGDCAKAGLVEPLLIEEKPVKRPGPTGSKCLVWKLTERGIEYVRTHQPEIQDAVHRT
jgi:hypothetical protein